MNARKSSISLPRLEADYKEANEEIDFAYENTSLDGLQLCEDMRFVIILS